MCQYAYNCSMNNCFICPNNPRNKEKESPITAIRKGYSEEEIDEYLENICP